MSATEETWDKIMVHEFSNSFYTLYSEVEFIKVPESGFFVVSNESNVSSLLQCFVLWANLFFHSNSKPWAFTYDTTQNICAIGRSYQYDANPGVGEIEAFVYKGEDIKIIELSSLQVIQLTLSSKRTFGCMVIYL